MLDGQGTQVNLGDNASQASIDKIPCDSCHMVSDVLHEVGSRLVCSECYDSESKKSCCEMCGIEDSKHTIEESHHCHIAFNHRLKELSEGN